MLEGRIGRRVVTVAVAVDGDLPAPRPKLVSWSTTLVLLHIRGTLELRERLCEMWKRSELNEGSLESATGSFSVSKDVSEPGRRI